VVVDDKLHVLAAIKKSWRNKVTTVFVRQGHYAFDRKILSSSPPADMTIEGIGDLLKFEKRDFLRFTASERFARRGRRKSGPRRA
jgi:hypothetical protein